MNQKIEPCWNVHLYWAALVVGFVIDIVLHIFAKNGVMGSSLMPYYYSLRFLPPSQNWVVLGNPIFKEWFYGGLLAGIAVVVGLLLSDILLQLIAWKQEKDETV